ncbi:MAG: hypothetical protein BWK76_23330 [Desulfobulbaceae bacterium A2]|nr:MAG: hypothetical protein BWK76_23330 [Desulfobulbaceae bacterium A2]
MAITTVRLLGLVPLIAGVGAGAAANAAESDQLAMYFDQSQMVEVASRAPKPLIQVAENVTVITADEIEAMHAQHLGEVLNRVAGVLVDLSPPDFNGHGTISIEGSREEHVLVLLDGVRLNSAMSGTAPLSHIPLRIIERIEIIKGPASAVWGSSQGGVINIFTKAAQGGGKPSGSVAAEWGEHGVGAYEAELAGTAERVGYYLYGGRQDSPGLLHSRFYNSDRLYGKVHVDLASLGKLTVTGSLIDPHYRTGDFSYMEPYFSQDTRDRTYFVTVNYDTPLSSTIHLNLGARQYERSFIDNSSIFSQSPVADPGTLFWQADWRERSTGANGLLTWRDDRQQVSLGAEIHRNTMDSTTDYGDWAQTNWGAPARDRSRPGQEEVWGAFVNDTLRFGLFTLTPGLRYDEHSISGSMVSPSLGATYQVRPDTLLRATATRGFQYPILTFIAGGGLWDNPNTALKPEKVTSFQLGAENRSLSFLSLKLNGFHHQISDSWWFDAEAGNWQNGGDTTRKGFEAEAETSAWHNLRLAANATYTLISPVDGQEDSLTTTNLFLRYRETKGWTGELAAHYGWLDNTHLDTYQSQDLIWSLNLGRTVYSNTWISCDLYGKINNLFNGTAYNDTFYPLPGRWFLAGMRLRF